MARPVIFNRRRTVRLTKETDKALMRRAKVMKLAPAVVLRFIVEHSLKADKPEEPTK